VLGYQVFRKLPGMFVGNIILSGEHDARVWIPGVDHVQRFDQQVRALFLYKPPTEADHWPSFVGPFRPQFRRMDTVRFGDFDWWIIGRNLIHEWLQIVAVIGVVLTVRDKPIRTLCHELEKLEHDKAN